MQRFRRSPPAPQPAQRRSLIEAWRRAACASALPPAATSSVVLPALLRCEREAPRRTSSSAVSRWRAKCRGRLPHDSEPFKSAPAATSAATAAAAASAFGLKAARCSGSNPSLSLARTSAPAATSARTAAATASAFGLVAAWYSGSAPSLPRARTSAPAATSACTAVVTAAAFGFRDASHSSGVHPSLSLALASAPASKAAWMATRQPSWLGSWTARKRAACSQATPGHSGQSQATRVQVIFAGWEPPRTSPEPLLLLLLRSKPSFDRHPMIKPDKERNALIPCNIAAGQRCGTAAPPPRCRRRRCAVFVICHSSFLPAVLATPAGAVHRQ